MGDGRSDVGDRMWEMGDGIPDAGYSLLVRGLRVPLGRRTQGERKEERGRVDLP
ncbi:MAG: hypothetical protein RI897_2806 [Verrucomicrobiota bacterium]|jgi:hypothetical protein